MRVGSNLVRHSGLMAEACKHAQEKTARRLFVSRHMLEMLCMGYYVHAGDTPRCFGLELHHDDEMEGLEWRFDNVYTPGHKDTPMRLFRPQQRRYFKGRRLAA